MLRAVLAGLDPFTTMAAIATFFLAGLVKGVIGLGLPTVSMGLLTAIMPPARAASLLIVPSFVTNVWQLLAGPRFGTLLRRLWLMMIGIALGTLAGAGLMQGDKAEQAAVALGGLLVIYAAIGLTVVRFSVPTRAEPWLAPVVGAVTGLITAATGVFVIPAVPFLGALGLAKDDLVQALGLSFTVSTIALAVALTGSGSFDGSTVGASVLALAPALLGMAVGGRLRDRVSETVFRRFFFFGLLALGAHLCSRAINW